MDYATHIACAKGATTFFLLVSQARFAMHILAFAVPLRNNGTTRAMHGLLCFLRISEKADKKCGDLCLSLRKNARNAT